MTVWQVPDAVDSVVYAPDDGWRNCPKHVEQFTELNKLCNVASCWLSFGISIYKLTNKSVDITHWYLHQKSSRNTSWISVLNSQPCKLKDV